MKSTMEQSSSTPSSPRRKFIIRAGLGLILTCAALSGAAWWKPQWRKRLGRIKDDLEFRAKDALTPRPPVPELAARLFHPDDALSVGSSGPALVEFVNYNCPTCKRQHRTLVALWEEGVSFRLITRQKCIPDTPSWLPAQAVLAATLQGRGAALHDLFMAHEGILHAQEIPALAAKAGVDPARLEADMEGDAVARRLENDSDLAWLLRLTLTPSFVTRTEALGGYQGREALLTMLDLADPNSEFQRF